MKCYGKVHKKIYARKLVTFSNLLSIYETLGGVYFELRGSALYSGFFFDVLWGVLHWGISEPIKVSGWWVFGTGHVGGGGQGVFEAVQVQDVAEG